MLNIDHYLIIGYFIIVIAIGYFSSRKETTEGFLIADRKLKWLNLTATISASLMSGGVLLSFVMYVYQFGLSAIWVFGGIALGLIWLMFYAKKLKLLGDKRSFYTISDYAYYKFDKKTGFMATIIIFLTFVCYLLCEFIAGGKILSQLTNISYSWAIIIMGIAVLFYLGIGGFKAVAKTDYFQYFIMLVFGLVVAGALTKDISYVHEQINMFGMGIGNAIAFVIIGAFLILMAPDVWQRIFAAKNVHHIRKGLFFSAILLSIYGLAISAIGLAVRSKITNIPADEALIYGMKMFLPAGLLGIGLVMLFAAFMSSLDTGLFILSMNISQDVISHFKSLSKHGLIKLTRVFIIIMTLLGIIISLLTQQILDVVFAGASITLALVPALLGSFHFNIKSKAAFWSILLGLISSIVVLSMGIIGPETSLVSLPVALVVLIICQFFCKS